ncbi:hypothetical protein [Lysinibacter cavernae]|uniref:DUF11 domain-containing protein n=1 Tax=Lysinibacter cavernae TaxID=1640652 RepID=A0A7X5TTT4_9MICO|nr:hypothetical protein [Lysinibacter cavernae]NIH53853.1 hypothetical protein [Lysinibacter cavernae]NIH53859.1 hypothetical protein [Lysinibacter cavernae]
MSATKDKTGNRRFLLASGVLLGCVLLTTAAAFTDYGDSVVEFDGANNRYDLQVAGSLLNGWEPVEADWAQGRSDLGLEYQSLEDGYQIDFAKEGKSRAVGPGMKIDFRIAVKNNSPRVGSSLVMEILDPDPLGETKDASSGSFLELFDQLEFTVKDSGTVLYNNVPASDLTTMVWDTQISPGDYKMLDVTISVPDDVDNRWIVAKTNVEFRFQGENT